MTGSPLVPAARHQGRGAPCGESFWHWALGADGGHGHAQPPFRSSRLIGAERQPTSDCRQSLQQSLRRHAHLALDHTSIEHSRDGVAVAKVVTSNSSQANEYLHGSARWAEKKDIQAAGLLPRERGFLEVVTGKDAPSTTGVYVGGWQDKEGNFHYLRHSGPEHVLTYAPTRSGKGVGLVVPTLLSWGASTVITDLKGELWALTAGWRQKHANNKVLRFEPASLSGGVAWNPLDEIRLGTESEVGDVQNLATLIVDPDGKGLDSHWQKTAFALLVGVILHALYKAKDDGTVATLPLVDALLADPDRDIGELWMEMATYGHVNGQNHHAIGSAARDMMDRPEEEAGSVLSTAKSYLALYRDPVVARNVSRSDFRIKDLMHSDNPVSLYIVTQPNDK